MLEWLELYQYEVIGGVSAICVSICIGWIAWWSFVPSELDVALAKKEFAVYDKNKNEVFYTFNPTVYKYDKDYEVLGKL